MQNTNSLKIVLLLVSLVALISAGLPKQEKFKNLKVLSKDISEKELDKVMDNFKIALGVDCNYCHARNPVNRELDFVSDKMPEKEIARKMMIMTSEINKKYFGFNQTEKDIQAVGCYTCHRGTERPGIDSLYLQGKN
jgi:hypothetical protein